MEKVMPQISTRFASRFCTFGLFVPAAILGAQSFSLVRDTCSHLFPLPQSPQRASALAFAFAAGGPIPDGWTCVACSFDPCAYGALRPAASQDLDLVLDRLRGPDAGRYYTQLRALCARGEVRPLPSHAPVRILGWDRRDNCYVATPLVGGWPGSPLFFPAGTLRIRSGDAARGGSD
jgi:hypothetical protein